MAVANLTITDSRYSTNVTGSWKGTSETNIWSGEPSNNDYSYFSYIEIAVGDLDVVSSTQLKLRLELNQASYLGGVLGVLAATKLASTKIQNSAHTGMSSTLSDAAIATSKACNESGEEYAHSSTTYKSGNYFYLFFDTTDISANTTYYVYLLPTATKNCWVSSARSKVNAELTYIDQSACGAPTAFSAAPSVFEDIITLSWSGATAGVNNAITGYEIQYTDSSNGSTWGSWKSLKTVAGTSTTDTPSISRGTYRKYRVRTQGAAGSSFYSEWKESKSVQKSDPVVYIHDGTEAVPHKAYIHNGTEFVRHIPYIFNGTEWVRYIG